MDPPPPISFDVVAVSAIRGVATDNVPATALDDLSRKLLNELGPTMSALEIGSEGGCNNEVCRIEAAEKQSATHLLHTRLVQYEGECLLLSVLYDVPTKKSTWGFVRELTCDVGGLSGAVSELAATFAGRPNGPPDKTMFLVVPVQHQIKDLDWAAESFGEYLTALFAEAGFAMTPASVAAQPLVEGGEKPHRSCRKLKCVIGLAGVALAQRALATDVRKRGRQCSVQTAIWEVGTKTSTKSAKAKGKCEAIDIAHALRSIALTLTERPPREDLEMAAPPPEPPAEVEPPPPAEPPPPVEPPPPEPPMEAASTGSPDAGVAWRDGGAGDQDVDPMLDEPIDDEETEEDLK